LTNPVRIAVASRSFSRHPILRAELLARYPSITFNESGRSLAGDELAAFLKGHDAAITALETIDEKLLDRCPELQLISKYGVGLDMLDLPLLSRRGIRLGWTGGVNRRSVAELVIAMAISLLRHVPQGNAEVRAGQWRQLMGRHLSERTVGIVGCGHVGKDLAQLLRAFGCTLLAHDIRHFPDFYAANGIEAVGLDELLARADVVTLHLPLDHTTRNILSAERLALMRPDAILVNAARGGLVDEAAMKRMLMDGRLAGAAFDVFAGEPPTDLELLRLPNFLATPHIGGSAEEAVVAMGRAAIDGLVTASVPEPASEVWRAAGAVGAGAIGG
jgi:D-3-phosphoglycerate dehydrogenase